MHRLPTPPPHTAQLALFNACPGISAQGASENELMCPQEKQTWCLPLFGLCIGLEKKWDFYVRKPSSRTPVCSCWANTTATDYKQAEGPSPGPGPYVTDPLLTSAFLFFQPLPHCINTQRLFNTLSENQESFSHGRPSSHTHGNRLYHETCERT